MFRAAYRSPSGALSFHSDLTTAGHHMRMETRGCKYSLELLMISGMPLETCWAFNERCNNKLYYKVASWWLFLLINIWPSILLTLFRYSRWSAWTVCVVTSYFE